jgi:hypothetical protein
MNFAILWSMLSVVCLCHLVRLELILLTDILPDVVTSSTSTVSWKLDDLENMIKLADGCSSESLFSFHTYLLFT